MAKKNGIDLRSVISVRRIYRLYYCEFASDYHTTVQLDTYWSFTFVKRGRIFLSRPGEEMLILSGQGAFHRPGDEYSIACDGVASNIIVVYFAFTNPLFAELSGKPLTLDEDAKMYISVLIKEAKYAFDVDFMNYHAPTLARNQNQLYGAEQMIRTLLEQFLISVYRKQKVSNSKNHLDIIREVLVASHTGSDDIFHLYEAYLEKNIHRMISVGELSSEFHVSPSYIKKRFKKVSNGGIIDYHNRMKIEYAKILIRETPLNISQIADSLGYSSVQYFSRVFHKLVKMPPSEYVRFTKM